MKVDVTFYYANWCGHCMEFKPIYNEVKEFFSNNQNVNFIEKEDNLIDEKDTINGKPIYAYPSIKLNTNNNEFQYNGNRTKEGLISEINNLLDIENFDNIDDNTSYNKYNKLKNLIINKNEKYNNYFKKFINK
tara:strand:- start:471 stop:869 length:399 start_codon:yes stop_codon:yes gene_type:complete